jgi:hypothetical protein
MYFMLSAWPESRFIARLLSELGAKQVDMLTTGARKKFESGELPCKAGVRQTVMLYIRRGSPAGYARLGVDAWSSRRSQGWRRKRKQKQNVRATRASARNAWVWVLDQTMIRLLVHGKEHGG